MKTRNGFVSNSSSSSFVVTCDADEFKKMEDKLHPLLKHILSYYDYSKEEGEIFGKKVVTFIIGHANNSEGLIEEMDSDEYADDCKSYLKSQGKSEDYGYPYEVVYEALDDLFDQFKKMKNKVTFDTEG